MESCISKRNFALRMGWSYGKVAELVRLGLPTENGLIDCRAAKQWIEANAGPNGKVTRASVEGRGSALMNAESRSTPAAL